MIAVTSIDNYKKYRKPNRNHFGESANERVYEQKNRTNVYWIPKSRNKATPLQNRSGAFLLITTDDMPLIFTGNRGD